MKSLLQHLLVLVFGAAILPVLAQAQTYSQVHGFSAESGNPPTNADGTFPYGGVLVVSNVIYGTTYGGGTNGAGVIYSVQTDGSHFTNLYSFSTLSTGTSGTNQDGAEATCVLTLVGNTLFGTAYQGGMFGHGSVFRINTDGSAFTNLHSFSDGAGEPRSGVVVTNNLVYGTSTAGGTGLGAIFRVGTDSTGFTNLYTFTANAPFDPFGPLLLHDGILYGTVSSGNGTEGGAIYAIGLDGNNYTNMFNFTKGGSSTNDDGVAPNSALIASGSTLYGITSDGGTNANGVIFSVSTNGNGFTNMHSFSSVTNGTNSDGINPEGGLLLKGDTLYGVAISGGLAGRGTVFSIKTNGAAFTTVYNFVALTNGNNINFGGNGPDNSLALSGSTIFGTTLFGGPSTAGNIFALDISASGPPVLEFQIVDGSLVLSWSDPTYSLESSTAVNGSFSPITNATSPYPVPITGLSQFFRLKQN